jgi:hypothetical protein
MTLAMLTQKATEQQKIKQSPFSFRNHFNHQFHATLAQKQRQSHTKRRRRAGLFIGRDGSQWEDYAI